MDILPENKALRTRLCGITALLGLGLFTACFLFARIEVTLTSDILMVDSFPSKLLSFLQKATVYLGFALFYSFSTFLSNKIGFIKTFPFIFIVIGLTVYRTILSLSGQYLIDKIDTYDFVLYVLPQALLSFGLELIQYLLVLFVIWLCMINVKRQATPTMRRPLLFVSLTVMAINIAIRIRYDIAYGAPTSLREVLQMVLAYASDILIYGVLLFFIMSLIAVWADKICKKQQI
ncbi:MAG: hypothetical protein J6B12_01005 [Clostridia bacterium]|nr:hypothetical protein [Clostridia bacterium]